MATMEPIVVKVTADTSEFEKALGQMQAVIPAPPALPSAWTPATIVSYVFSAAVFIVGLLTAAGVVVPPSVSSDIQLFSGLAAVSVGAGTALVTTLSKNSVTKAQLVAHSQIQTAAVNASVRAEVYARMNPPTTSANSVLPDA